MSSRLDWNHVTAHAADIARSYGSRVTLRQLFYRLVADGTLPNQRWAYSNLSHHTAEARRNGAFPRLVDLVRHIDRPIAFADLDSAKTWLKDQYRLDRTQGQPWSIYVACEKAALLPLFQQWFEDRSIPIIVTRGYASQSYTDIVANDAFRQERPAVLLYVGDFDPTGEDIERDFVRRTFCWQERRRVALTPEQVQQYSLPPMPGKASDNRAGGFKAKYGQLVQVEVDALPPDTLQQLLDDAIAEYWDADMYATVLAQEEADREALSDDYDRP